MSPQAPGPLAVVQGEAGLAQIPQPACGRWTLNAGWHSDSLRSPSNGHPSFVGNSGSVYFPKMFSETAAAGHVLMPWRA